MNDEQISNLRLWMEQALAARVVIEQAVPLQGGSIQENWRLMCRIDDMPRDLVLRRDAPATIASSRARKEEFALLSAAFEAGVKVPPPVANCNDNSPIGTPFLLMERVDGIGLGPRIVKDQTLGGDRTQLGERLGRELAMIHGIAASDGGLAFLGPRAATSSSQPVIDGLRRALDALGAVRPALEWGLRWAERNAPPAGMTVLLHNDYRTGNYMVDQNGLTAIVDWEFAGWGDPHADIGWFCAECWRFGRNDLEAGGIATRSVFYAGYETASGRRVDDAAVRYWEVLAHLRWAVIALEQGARHTSGREPSLELALTGRIVPELELAVLRASAPSQWIGGAMANAG